MTRYAIYYAPRRGSAWWNFGARWLGRDEHDDQPLAPQGWLQMPTNEFQRMTGAASRYGFHATLKAPFHLAGGCNAEALLERVRLLARALKPLPLGTLVPVFMDGFVALVPSRRNPALSALAQACVEQLDDLRAPLDEAARSRRRIDPGDARAQELFERYGYPHVLERFRFHMTLTGPIDTALAGKVVAQIARPVAQLNTEAPPVLDRLCVFAEPRAGAPLRRIADVELAP